MGGKTPTAVSVAEIQIGSVGMRVYHLDNGQRVIDAQSMADFMAALEDGTLLLTEEDSMKLAKAVST